MGSFNETCAFTNLPVTCGDPVLGLVVKRNNHEVACYPFDMFCPVVPFIRGTYDDYGGIKIDEAEDAKLVDFGRRAFLDLSGEKKKFGIPAGFWLVMIRQDTFGFLRSLPSSSGNRSIGFVIDDLRQKLREAVSPIVKLNEAIAATGEDEDEIDERANVNRFLKEMEATRILSGWTWELGEVMRKTLVKPFEELLKSRTATQADFDYVTEPILELLTLQMAMSTGRRALFPVGSVGSQDWEPGPQVAIANFIISVASERQRQEHEWAREWGEDEDEDDEAP